MMKTPEELFSRLAEIFPPAFAEVFHRFQANFAETDLSLYSVTPGNTQSFSVTGANCDLQCAHCSGHYLQGMKPFSTVSRETLQGKTSILLSGGSDRDGRVPLHRFAAEIAALPPTLPLNLHVGWQDARDLQFLAGRPVTVSYDLIGSAATVKDIFGLDIDVAEIRRAYLDLSRTFPTIPHITLGLHGGRLVGEYDSLQFLQEHQPPATTLLIFRPTPGTRLADCSPPTVAETSDFFLAARTALRGPVHLGCMRPAGNYRLAVDTLAWWLGLRTIVHPHPVLRRCLQTAGVPIIERHECCSLDTGGLHA